MRVIQPGASTFDKTSAIKIAVIVILCFIAFHTFSFMFSSSSDNSAYLEQFQDELDELKTSTELTLQEWKDEMEEKIAGLKKEITEAQEESMKNSMMQSEKLGQLETDLKELRSEVESDDEPDTQKDQQIESLTEEVQLSKNMIETLKAQVKELEDKTTELEKNQNTNTDTQIDNEDQSESERHHTTSHPDEGTQETERTQEPEKTESEEGEGLFGDLDAHKAEKGEAKETDSTLEIPNTEDRKSALFGDACIDLPPPSGVAEFHHYKLQNGKSFLEKEKMSEFCEGLNPAASLRGSDDLRFCVSQRTAWKDDRDYFSRFLANKEEKGIIIYGGEDSSPVIYEAAKAGFRVFIFPSDIHALYRIALSMELNDFIDDRVFLFNNTLSSHSEIKKNGERLINLDALIPHLEEHVTTINLLVLNMGRENAPVFMGASEFFSTFDVENVVVELRGDDLDCDITKVKTDLEMVGYTTEVSYEGNSVDVTVDGAVLYVTSPAFDEILFL